MARTAACSAADGRARLATARVYLELAAAVVGGGTSAAASASAGNAVLAGIAAGDAICCVRLGRRHRGDDHRSAADLLGRATPDGRSLATTFTRLISLKDTAHYGAELVSPSRARDAVRWAQRLVERAAEELER